ncbi:hypothetical protein C2845_PM15G08330 [Panicum miliaceum]|uniref:Uncharacterized protein n=1 Tax=Panicum miliaceum TaxID=4540 RepID=A0A3L6Q9M0_PANMI|nr:hypothetical protein C2845_PM15G08330 [Panicum miliaceum]
MSGGGENKEDGEPGSLPPGEARPRAPRWPVVAAAAPAPGPRRRVAGPARLRLARPALPPRLPVLVRAISSCCGPHRSRSRAGEPLPQQLLRFQLRPATPLPLQPRRRSSRARIPDGGARGPCAFASAVVSSGALDGEGSSEEEEKPDLD